MAELTSNSRTLQACEPCRRKKSKCTGERPACSFCRRLGQTCVYNDRRGDLIRDRKRRQFLPNPTGTDATSRRLAELEATVEDLVGAITEVQTRNGRHKLIHSTTRSDIGRPTHPSEMPALTEDSQLPQATSVNFGRGASLDQDFDPAKWLEQNTSTTFDTLIEVYTRRLHGQPLLLFDPELLSQDMRVWPEHLFFSFVAMISNFTTYPGRPEDLVQISSSKIDTACFENIACIQSVQALCLLILWEISHGERTKVSLHMGMAQALSIHLIKSSQSPGSMASDISRCWCSVMILDCMASREPVLPLLHWFVAKKPDQAISPPLPRPPISRTHTLPAVAPFASPPDTGIYCICVDLYKVWTKARSLAESVRKGQAASLWHAQSPYQEARTAIFDFESRMSSNHRLREIGFSIRSSTEIAESLQYWRMWFTTQVLFHSTQLLINHPLIHMINGRKFRSFQPPSFQQQTIDQALLHAKWVIRLHQMRVEKGLEVDDPFIAYLSAVVATAYVFFLNCKDPKIRADARKGFDDCCTMVTQFAHQWKFLQRTSKLLEALFAKTGVANKTDQLEWTAPVSWFWDLLNYCETTPNDNTDFSTETVNLEITTQFTSPVDGPDVHEVEGSIETACAPNEDDIQLGLGDPNDPWFLALNTNFVTNTYDISTLTVDSNIWLDHGQL